MKRALLALLLCGCAASQVRPTKPTPSWAGDESVWVDPHPDATLGWGGNMEQAARVVQNTLLSVGFQPGRQDDPNALVVKMDLSTGLVSFTLQYKVMRGARTIQDEKFDMGDIDCWHALSSIGSKIECIGLTVVDRILASPALALEHTAPKPATVEAEPAPQPVARVKLSGRLAVLDLRNLTKDLSPDDARYFTDLIRAAVLKFAPQLDVMTRENLLVLLRSTGKDLANCEGECEVDTGRRIGADAIISGEIQRIGTRYKISLRLHETHEGRLAGASVASGKSIDELDDSANKAVATLFEGTR